jgi:hypothetical protein
MPEPKLSPAQFAEKLRSKYPQYASIDDVTLVDKVLQKYPQYGDIVNVNDAGEEVKKKEFSEVSVLRPTEEPSASDTSTSFIPKGEAPLDTKAPEAFKTAVSTPKFEPTKAIETTATPRQEVTTKDWWADKWNGLIEGVQTFAANVSDENNANGEAIADFIQDNKTKKPELFASFNENLELLKSKGYDDVSGRGMAANIAYTDSWRKDNKIENEVLPYIRQKGREKSTKNFGIQIDEKVQKELGDRFFSGAVRGLATSTPAMLTSASTMGMSFFNMSYNNAEEQLARQLAENPNLEMTRAEKETYKVTNAGIEAVLERVGLGNALKGNPMLKRAITGKVLTRLSGVGDDVGAEAFEKIVKQEVKGLAGYARKVAAGSISEFETGALQQLSNDLINQYVTDSQGKNIFSPKTTKEIITDVLYAGAQEAIGGGIISGAVAPFQKSALDMTKQEFESGVDFAKKVDIQKVSEYLNKEIETGKITEDQASQTLDRIQEFNDLSNKLPDDISKQGQYELFQLIAEKQRLQKSVVGKDEVIQQTITEDVNAINQRIKEVYDTQKETGVPSPVVEREAPIEVQPIQVASGTSLEADRVLQVLDQQEVFQKIAEAQEVDNNEAQEAQQQILNDIDEVDALDIADDVKTAYIQTLEDKFDDIEYYENKTITTTEQVTEEVPIGAPRAGSRTIVEPEVRRGKFRLFERLNNLEVSVGTETEGQTSVIETQDDGSIDVVTYDKNTKQEVSRQPKVAENILGLEYVESILDVDGNLTGVVMRPKTPKGEDISPVRIQVVNRPELALDIAIDARKKEIGDVPEVIWMQEYETVTREVTTKEQVPAAKRLERKAARVVLPTEAVAAEQVTEEVVEQEPTKNKKGLTSEQVTEAVSAAKRLSKRLGLSTKIVAHNSRKEFNEAMNEVSKSGSVASGVESGRFIPSRNEIHLNLEDMTSEVPFHEVFHAAFVNRFGKASQATREKTASDFQSGLLRVLRSGTAEDQQLAEAVERFVKDGEYSAKESPEEFMAQTAGFIATSGKKISKTTMDKLIQWLNNFIGKISPSLKVTTRGEFIDFMNSFSGALFEAGIDSRDVSEVVSEIDEASSKQSDSKAIDAALAIVKNVNNKYPEAVEQQVVSAEFKEDKFGKKGTLYDVKSIPYKLSDGAKRYFGENAVEKLSDKIVSDVKKYEGNKDISKGIGWYSNFRTQFQRKFGASLELFGQLLAATSAQTPVDVNFRQAIDALRQYSKGSYDNLIKDYSKYVDSIEKMSRQDIIDSIEVRTKRKKANYTDLDIINEKRKLINEFKDVPLQSNGKKFNANSAKVLQAIYGNWLSQTQGPKTKNFAGNLTGRSYEATIDVWAARYLRRIIYKDNVSRWRIHPKQEGAVEHTVSVDGVTGGDYFFAEEVMRKAAEKLNWNADDLQAFLWFLEKDIWSRNNWTGAAGRKKSSFEEEAEKLLTERYQAGVTTFKDFGTFNKEEFEAAKVELLNTIRAVDGLIVGRVVESEGEYYSPSGDVYAEPTFDVEFSVDEGTDVSSIEAKVIEIGKRYNQEAVLFSKITEKKEKNSAPIIEIGLKNPSKNSKTIDSIKKMLSGLGVRGFTVSRDSQGNILGVRTQYIKEFEGQPISFGEILFSNAEK